MARAKRKEEAQPEENAASPEIMHELLEDLANSPEFTTLRDDIAEALARKAEGDGTLRAYFAHAKREGHHVQALKLVLRLERMSEQKRADFLRGFDIYREAFAFDQNADLFEQQENNIRRIQPVV